MRPLKAELDAVSQLLEQEWEDVQELAAAVIHAVDEARTDVKRYSIWLWEPGTDVAYTIGPYAGLATAHNALRDNRVPTQEGMKYHVAGLYTPEYAKRSVDASRDPNR